MADPTSCGYCGLPAPAVAWPWPAREDDARAEPWYCCFGCRFAAAVAGSGGEEGAAAWTLARLGLAIFLTMNVMVFTMALWSSDLFEVEPGQALGPLVQLFRYLCLLFSLPVLVLLGGPLLENAWAGLRRGQTTSDVLLVLGVAASYLYSAVSVVRGEGHVYFEVGCMVLLLVTLGRWLEARGKLQATRALEALQKLLPEKVRLLRQGQEIEVPREDIQAGDLVRIGAGERIPCDGTVHGQPANVDEQILTGESSPRLKEPGEPIHGGTLNLDCDLLLRAVPGAAALARMVELMRLARLTRGHYQCLADRVTAWFLPLVIVLAVVSAIYQGRERGPEQGILTGLAVVLIACPCALGLATPMALWAALGRAAQQQVLFRSGEELERLARVRGIFFDKTGTLTTGEPTVADFRIAVGEDAVEVLARAKALAASSRHGQAQAIKVFGGVAPSPPTPLPQGGRGEKDSPLIQEREEEKDSPLPQGGREEKDSPLIQEREEEKDTPLPQGGRGEKDSPLPQGREENGWSIIKTLPGRGLAGEVLSDSETTYLGSWRLMQEKNLAIPSELVPFVEGDQPLTCIGWGGQVRGLFLFQEQPREQAHKAVAALQARGLAVGLLTGDHPGRGEILARQWGLSVQAGLLPEDKVSALEQAQRRLGPVAMVGDGINDAPALASSAVGIALGCGADIARASAGVCLLGNDLLLLPWSFDLACATIRVIRQNLFWAFAYNVVGIGLASTGRLNPVLAALAMVVSSLLVVANSLRLGRL